MTLIVQNFKPSAYSYYNGFGNLAFPKYREEKWFCIWDDLLCLIAIAGVANLKTGINLNTIKRKL